MATVASHRQAWLTTVVFADIESLILALGGEVLEREGSRVKLGVRPIIGFHGETVVELRAQFIAAVDDYLEDCAAQGISPEKPASGNLMLRVPPEVHGAVLVAAQASGKSLNQWAAEVLKNAASC
ncbi:type II toxin-antitoxin system HicB family antitoxin [Acidithiobacillus ferriphilus]|uniref:type II toxin-antitoxin system HicB family antitoxin n=1 Tax=Acidithiobacillus ferriphilus TaxID=1689834 RepID=UPI00232B9ED8|nr:type II toxin-antitoxin system HicB family antitoxin [Acidithiobacillus ferriphilus]WCE94609.1 type II toxin-antitoxin system HicB family antitoxin [Acidithiobacillus ferriphilus]